MFWCYVVVSCVYFDVYGMFVMLVELVDYVCLCFYFGVDQQMWMFVGVLCMVQVVVIGWLKLNYSEVLCEVVFDGVGIVLLFDWLVDMDFEVGCL